jgi:hypothetical protein
MPYELSTELETGALLLGGVGAAAGLALAALAVAAPRIRWWPEAVMACLTLLSAAGLLVVAGSDDAYAGQVMSRWAFGGVGGRAVTVVALIVGAGALVLMGVARRVPPMRSLRGSGLLLAGLGCGLDLVAVVALSIGH